MRHVDGMRGDIPKQIFERMLKVCEQLYDEVGEDTIQKLPQIVIATQLAQVIVKMKSDHDIPVVVEAMSMAIRETATSFRAKFPDYRD